MGIVEMIPQALNTALFAPGVYAAVASLAVIIATWGNADRATDKLQHTFESKEDTFDFIVVGSGSAGAVVAYRLSEYFNVLLLEAGGSPHPLQSIPGFALFMQNYPEIDWMHRTVPLKRSCFACPNSQSSWSQGKGLGGTSNLNFMIHSRGNFRDFDNWGKITGDPSWSYDGLLPFFKRYEDFYGNTTDPYSHGIGGRIRLEVPDYRGMADEFIWAANELGYPQADLNGRFAEGYDHVFYPIRKGVRQAVYQSYIQPGRKRASLTIRKFAHVNRVLTRGKHNEAYAVEYDRHGETKLAFARKEIIISAGAVQSPKILMLSGIGPWEHLKDMGIPKVADLPVGKNLQDHVGTYLGPFFVSKPRSFLIDRELTPKAFADLAFGKGPLTTTAIQGAGFITSSLAKERGEWDWPDIQHNLFGLSVHKTFAWDMANAFGLKEDVLTKYYAHALGKESFSIITSNGRPVARGEILLGGKDPYDALKINPKYYEDPWDMDINVSVEAIQIALKMVEETRAFASVNAHFTEEVFPGCEKYLFRSNEYFQCYLRHYTVSLHHASGTCAMGAKNSPHTVVDTELKVLGVGGLRVIDASVMPTLVVGGTQAATIAIGEKGAAMILDYWEHRPLEELKHGVYSQLGNSHRPGLALLGIPSQPLSLFSPKVKPVYVAAPLYDSNVYSHSHHDHLVADKINPTIVLKDSHKPLYDLGPLSYRVKRDLFHKDIRSRLRNVTVNSFPVKKGAKSSGPYSPENIPKEPMAFSQVLATKTPLAKNSSNEHIDSYAKSDNKDSLRDTIKDVLSNRVQSNIKHT